MIATITETLVGLWNAFPSLIAMIFYAVWDSIVDAVNWGWTRVLGYSSDLIAPSWSLDVSGIMPYVDAITYMFPVYQTLGIVAATYSVVFGVRAARWLMACIPLVNLG